MFLEALERPVPERAAFVRNACDGNADLLRDVESLLTHHVDGTAGMVEAVAAETMSLDPDLTTPASIGSYRILGVLGEGGMGIVYEAEQRHPRRRVALKVMRSGPLVDELRLRLFDREVEMLGRLRHPDIAAIHESGHTDDGRRYLVMERVRGWSLAAWLQSRPVSASDSSAELRLRLRVFARIAEAVSYAHQRGVIHRDLKPANIFVVEDAGEAAESPEPAVKILDFGLARLADDSAAGTALSRAGQIRGTVPYMSPEQVQGDSRDIDMRTDVYSLGVLLYEMIAQRLPYEVDSASLLEAARVIATVPPRPLREESRSRIDSDVETIVRKALEKDPRDRYASVAGFAGDVRRWLAQEPILARPPSAVYQLRKLGQRHRGAVIAVTAIALVLVVSAVVSTGLYVRAERAAAQARTEAGKAEQVSSFMTKLLSSVRPSAARGRDATMLREILDGAATEVGSALDTDPEVEATMRTVLGITYRDLGEYEPAEHHLRAALELRRQALGDDHPSTLESMEDLGWTVQRRGRYDEVESLHRELMERRTRELGGEDPRTLVAMHMLAHVYQNQFRLAEAESLYAATLDARRRVLGEEDPGTLSTVNNLANVYSTLGRPDDAARLHEAALDVRRRTLGADHPITLTSMNNLANSYYDRGRLQEAEELQREVLAVRLRVLGEDHPETLSTLHNLGNYARDSGRLEEAERLYVETLTGLRRVLGDTHPQTLVALFNLGGLYAMDGRREEALDCLREAVRGGWAKRYLFEDGAWDSLRDDPEFQGIEKEVRAIMAERARNAG